MQLDHSHVHVRVVWIGFSYYLNPRTLIHGIIWNKGDLVFVDISDRLSIDNTATTNNLLKLTAHWLYIIMSEIFVVIVKSNDTYYTK